MTARPLSTDFLLKNVACLRAALDHHNATCEGRPTAFLLHPYDRGLLPFDELWGVPLIEDRDRAVKGFRVECHLEHDGGEQPALMESAPRHDPKTRQRGRAPLRGSALPGKLPALATTVLARDKA
jgi:hypothetical protein